MKKTRVLVKNKKKHITKSIRMKFFGIMTICIIAIIIVVMFINRFTIESYYLYQKKDALLDSYTSIKNNINTRPEIEKMAITNNYNIIITDNDDVNLYNSNIDFKQYMLSLDEIEDDKIIYKENDVIIIETKDEKNQINFLMLIGKLNNENTIYIRMPLSAVKDAAKISNDFLYYIGTMAFIIGGIAMLIISKKFTKPISELSDIANKMSNLDFSKKYRIKDSDDEIDNLGKSINAMSDKLEYTINKLKQSNNELERDVEEKSKIDEMRKQFISGVSHELKTPIALIQGYSEGLIENVNSNEDSRKFYAEVILDEANKMDEMVKGLLELMRLEYGAKKINNTLFNITELIQKELRKYTVMLNEKSIEVKFNLKEPVYAYADLDLIEKVLNNYISNSIKNAEEVNKEKYIKIYIKIIENKIRVFVFNTGKNISKEKMKKIWDRFYKEDNSRNRDMSGTGIGLSLVKAIMNSYNNEYGVQNKENGIEFYFDLNIK